MKNYQLVCEAISTESDKNKKRMKHYGIAAGLAGAASGIVHGIRERAANIRELEEIQIEYFKDHIGIEAYDLWKASPQYKEYIKETRLAIIKGATKAAIMAIFIVAVYAFLRESKRKFNDAQRIKRIQRN